MQTPDFANDPTRSRMATEMSKNSRNKEHLVLLMADFRQLVFARPVLNTFAGEWIPDIEISLGEMSFGIMRHCIDEAENEKQNRAHKTATSS
jgi:hypothetical protein